MNKKETKGLSEKDIPELRKKYGFNSVEKKELSLLTKIFKKFTNPIVIMIELAFFLSLLAGKYEDSIIILLLLLVNIGVEFWQEHKSTNALKALKKNLAFNALVFRDNAFKTIPARELLPGDVVKITIGDVVPADVKILDDKPVVADQSAITGESLPVHKKKGDILYSSSIIQKGSSLALVTKIGKDTFIGKSISLVAKAETMQKGHFQETIFIFAKFLSFVSAFLIVFTVFFEFLRGKDFLDIIQFALVLAVASIPVALPAVLSVTMAIGADILSRHRAIVSNFKATEELAGVDVLCVDKTGTLTENRLTVVNPKSYNNFSVEKLFLFAYYAMEKEKKGSIESAIEKYAKKNNFLKNYDQSKVFDFIPFNPESKFTEAFIEEKQGSYSIRLGAPQVIAKNLPKNQADILLKDVKLFAEDGLRVLALSKKTENKTELVGILPMLDPPRYDSKKVIQEVKENGIRIKMISGDNSAIVSFIGKILGLKGPVVNSDELNKSFNKETLIGKRELFAEVVPEDKYRIVEFLQKKGSIVGMTGDGVNDAPALKKADVGIAVAGATPAARQAADLVLLDAGLGAILKAIEYSRVIFARMQSYATFRIAETIRIVFFISLSIFFFGFSPITAVMIVVLALLNDIPVMAIAYDNAPVAKKPVSWHPKEIVIVASVLGFVGLVASFLLLYILTETNIIQDLTGQFITMATIYTIMFLKLDVSGHSTLYTTRTLDKHFWARPFPSLKFFIPAFGSRLIGTALAYFGIFMEPVNFATIVFVWIYSTLFFLINDTLKVLTYKIMRKYFK